MATFNIDKHGLRFMCTHPPPHHCAHAGLHLEFHPRGGRQIPNYIPKVYHNPGGSGGALPEKF